MDPRSEAAKYVPKSVLKEDPAAGGTPEQQMVRGINEEMTKGNWLGAVEAARKSRPIDAGRIGKKADEIGATRDASGKKDRSADPDEQKRFTDFTDAAKLNKDFLEKGYDAFPQGDKDKLRGYVQSVIISNPALSSEFSSITSATEQQRRIELILKDPKNAASLKEVVNGILEQKITIEDSQIQDKAYEATDKADKRVEADRIVKEIEQQVKDVDKALKEFERDSAGGAIGSKAISLDAFRPMATLQRETNTLKNDLRNKNNELEGLKAELDGTKRGVRGATRAIPDINADILAKDLEIRTAESKIEVNEKDLQDINKLQVEETSLKEKKIELGRNKSLKDVDLKKADLELSKINRQLGDLRRVRADQEIDLVNGMTNAVSEATNQYFIKQLEAAETAYSKVSGEDQKKFGNADEQAVAKAMGKRWERIEKAGTKKEKILICKEKVNADFLGLIKNGGSEQMLREMLKGETNIKTKAVYTDSEIDALFADKSDGSFYKKMTGEVTLQTVRRKILAGGITPADVFNIQSSNWGEGMIKLALEKNKAVAAEMESLIGEKMINNSGFMPRLWEQTKKKPWLLATLLGIVALPILAAKEGTAQTASYVK